jgi:alkylation response protein AidB-like acyl-CoA dehydrogenase
METPARDAASYIRAAGILSPQVQRLRTEIERDRTLPASLVASMADGGLFRLWLARAFGGPELSFTEFACVIEELSRADGSVGWCANIAAGLSRLSGYLPEQVCREIFADDSGRLSGSFSPTGKAAAVPGGFRVSGRWSYGSLIQPSHWTIGNSIVYEDETPRRGDHGAPDIRFMIFPTSAVEVIDNWYVSGLRGTGSHDFQVHDIFVPKEFTLSGTTAKPRQPGTLYAVPMITIFAATNACVSIGIARAAIDAFVALSQDKLPTGSAVRLRDKSVVQVDLARAEATLRS